MPAGRGAVRARMRHQTRCALAVRTHQPRYAPSVHESDPLCPFRAHVQSCPGYGALSHSLLALPCTAAYRPPSPAPPSHARSQACPTCAEQRGGALQRQALGNVQRKPASADRAKVSGCGGRPFTQRQLQPLDFRHILGAVAALGCRNIQHWKHSLLVHHVVGAVPALGGGAVGVGAVVGEDALGAAAGGRGVGVGLRAKINNKSASWV